MGVNGCRCLIDARHSPRVPRRRRQRLSRRVRLALAVGLTVPALVLSLGTTTRPAPVVVTAGAIAMSSCQVEVTVCEVEMSSAALPAEASVRLTDGPLSIAPTQVIGVALVLRHSGSGHQVRPEMLHAYFRLPRRHGPHWRLTIEARHRTRRSVTLPGLHTPSGAL